MGQGQDLCPEKLLRYIQKIWETWDTGAGRDADEAHACSGIRPVYAGILHGLAGGDGAAWHKHDAFRAGKTVQDVHVLPFVRKGGSGQGRQGCNTCSTPGAGGVITSIHFGVKEKISPYMYLGGAIYNKTDFTKIFTGDRSGMVEKVILTKLANKEIINAVVYNDTWRHLMEEQDFQRMFNEKNWIINDAKH